MENKKFYQLKNKNILENSPDKRINHNNNLRILQDEMGDYNISTLYFNTY